MNYLNLSFQSLEHGVPQEELTGVASLIHKANKKSLLKPEHFRKITVCALLGQIKQMAVCDLALPIMRPLKPQSQLGFTPGLFVKLSNLIVTEKRALALYHNLIVLHQFLDAMAAFDETLHAIILNQMYQGGIKDDIWTYFQKLHSNATTHVKWQGLLTTDCIQENKGNRQGGISSADEWKLYNNDMIRDLELACTKEDYIAGVPTTVVAVADDVAPSATASSPREAIHKLQLLLNVVETHGTQLHMKFGVEKCKLLISARPKKMREVENLLRDEPNLLTLFGKPVSLVKDFYQHIGVPQAPRNQSKIIIDQRISKATDMYYMLQDSIKNSLCGVSPLSNRKVFFSYIQPIFVYGIETMEINKADLKRLEISFRGTLKKMMSLSDNVASPAVYLSAGVLPAEAQRDIEVLGLLGQLAVCPEDLQNIRKIIEHDLAFYGEGFHGWSSLVRKVCAKYGLPDPLQYIEHPWRPDRWRHHCRQVVGKQWEASLKETAITKDSLAFFDIESASVFQPTKTWVMAGLDSLEVKKATITNWMQLGTYKTREKLQQFKSIKSDLCLACEQNQSENLNHLIFRCPFYEEIRQPALTKLFLMNPKLIQIMEDVKLKMVLVLDPTSKLLPTSISEHWSQTPSVVYALCRDMLYNLHKKRDKLYKKMDKL